jgi:hypothetical protein
MQSCLAWWCTPVISALKRLRQEDLEFKAILDYMIKVNKYHVLILSLQQN